MIQSHDIEALVGRRLALTDAQLVSGQLSECEYRSIVARILDWAYVEYRLLQDRP
jgi:hypothetical protein